MREIPQFQLASDPLSRGLRRLARQAVPGVQFGIRRLLRSRTVPVVLLLAGGLAVANVPVTEAADWPSVKAVGGKRRPEVPGYARTLREHPGAVGKDSALGGVIFGLEHRSRYEMIRRFYRETDLPNENQYLTRTRLYLGVREVLDPLRLTVELEDSRRFRSDLPPNSRAIGSLDFLQAYAELHTETGPAGLPLSLRAGRFTIDAAERSMIAANVYANTANRFDGLRLVLGSEQTAWLVDLFATRPVELRLHEFDNRSDRDRILLGGYVALRGLLPGFVAEPFWYYLEDERSADQSAHKAFHTAGLHLFGRIGTSAFDYDVTAAVQWGRNRGQDHAAEYAHLELGYTLDPERKVRVAAWLNYGSGDGDDSDGRSGRLEQPFNAPFGTFGYTRYFNGDNMINGALHGSGNLLPGLRLDAFLRSYRLEDSRDGWARAGRRDPGGTSGRHLGEEMDLRLRWKAFPRVRLDLGYAHFFPGSFVRRTGGAPDSHLVFLQTVLKL